MKQVTLLFLLLIFVFKGFAQQKAAALISQKLDQYYFNSFKHYPMEYRHDTISAVFWVKYYINKAGSIDSMDFSANTEVHMKNYLQKVDKKFIDWNKLLPKQNLAKERVVIQPMIMTTNDCKDSLIKIQREDVGKYLVSAFSFSKNKNDYVTQAYFLKPVICEYYGCTASIY